MISDQFTHNVQWREGDNYCPSVASMFADTFGELPNRTIQFFFPCSLTKFMIGQLADIIGIKYIGVRDDTHLDSSISDDLVLTKDQHVNLHLARLWTQMGHQNIAVDIRTPEFIVRLQMTSSLSYPKTVAPGNDYSVNETSSVVFTSFNSELQSQLLAWSDQWIFPKRKNTGQVSVIVQDAQSVRTIERPIIAPHYVDGTECKNERDDLLKSITISLERQSRGLILLHGDPGTGKTTFIRSMIAAMPNRKFIIMPPEMFEQISSPSFMQFMLTTALGAILIIEDGERLLTKRAGGDSSAGISTLLNMGDGLLADVLTTPIICTFNMTTSDVDPAIIRGNRLIKMHEFKALTASDVTAILDYENIPTVGLTVPNKVLTTADVYAAIAQYHAGNTNGFEETFQRTAKVFGFTQR